MRILYIEDNMANFALVKRVTGGFGHELINYPDGETALERLETDDPDLVLLDLQLAGEMHGLEVVKQMRADGKDVPVIAVTAYAMIGDEQKCLDAGCDAYLMKPVPIPNLLELLKRYDPNIPNIPSYPSFP